MCSDHVFAFGFIYLLESANCSYRGLYVVQVHVFKLVCIFRVLGVGFFGQYIIMIRCKKKGNINMDFSRRVTLFSIIKSSHNCYCDLNVFFFCIQLFILMTPSTCALSLLTACHTISADE